MTAAREAARRVVCSSNQRQLVFSFITYAADNVQKIPAGHLWSTKQFNYVIADNTSGLWTPLGLIYTTQYMPHVDSWTCPSHEARPLWPPEDHTDQIIRSSFGLRPALKPGATGTPWRWAWPASNPASESHFVNINAMPATSAWLADICSTAVSIDNRHGDGLNAARIGGSVGWVSRTHFDNALVTLPMIFSSAANDQFQAVWDALDRPE